MNFYDSIADIAARFFPELRQYGHFEALLKAKAPPIYDLMSYTSGELGYADTIPHEPKVDPWTVQTSTGGYVTTWRYSGADHSIDSLTSRARRNAQLNDLVKNFGEGWTDHAHLDRTEVDYFPGGEYPDQGSWLVAEERRREFEANTHYASSTYISLIYQPPLRASEQKKRLLSKPFIDEREITDTLNLAYDEFNAKVEEFERAWSAHFEITRLGERIVAGQFVLNEDGDEVPLIVDDQLSLYKRIAMGVWDTLRAIPRNVRAADYIATGPIVHRDNVVRVANTLMRPITIIDFPTGSTPDILDVLDRIPGELIASWRFINESESRIRRDIKRARGSATQRKLPFKSFFFPNDPNAMLDLDAAYMEADAEHANGVFSSKSARFGYATTTITPIVHIRPDESEEDARERLTALASQVIAELRARFFAIVEELGNELQAVRGMLPGNTRDNVIKPMLSSRVFMDFIPTTHADIGHQRYAHNDEFYPDEEALFVLYGAGRTPYYFIHSFPQRGSNILILGDPRTGKSSFAGFTMNQLRKKMRSSPRGFFGLIIDKGGSHAINTLSGNGERRVLSVDIPAAQGLNVFGDLRNPRDLQRALARLMYMLRCQGLDANLFKTQLYAALTGFSLLDPSFWNMSGFLRSHGLDNNVVKALNFYSRDGACGELFENTKPLTTDAGTLCIDIAPLDSQPAIKDVALFVTWTEADRLADGSVRMALLSEELWTLANDPEIDPRMIAFLKDKPKKGLSTIMVTHNIDDLKNSMNPKAYIDHCATRVIFASESLGTEDNVKALTQFGVPAHVIRYHAKHHTGKNIALIIQGSHYGFYSVKLGPVARTTVALTNDRERELAEEIIENAGEDWYPELIRAFAPPAVAEGWRRHAYYFARPEEEVQISAPHHAEPHPTDPFSEDTHVA